MTRQLLGNSERNPNNQRSAARTAGMCTGLLAAAALVLFGCDPADFEPEVAERHVDSADQQYIDKQAEPGAGKKTYLDLSDDTQYRFAMDRIRDSGKDPDNAPELFETLGALRKHHIKLYADGRTGEIRPKSNFTGDHLISSYTVDNATQDFEATAFSTTPGISVFTYVDIVARTIDGHYLGSGYEMDFAGGEHVVARAFGAEPTAPGLVTLSSLAVIVTDTDVYISYATLTTTNLNPPVVAGNESTSSCQSSLSNPEDKNDDGWITVCLSRNFGNCDYSATYPTVEFPFDGTMCFPEAIQQIGNTAAKINGIGSDHGMMQFNGFDALDFLPVGDSGRSWSYADPQFVNVNGAGIPFSSSEQVDFFVQIDMNPQSSPTTTITGLFSSLASNDPYLQIPPMRLVYSCLAEGTEIRMADRSLVKIEDIGKGQSVRTDASGMDFEVIDTSVGVEDIAMVRIRDSEGRTLLMTETHPVVTSERGIIWASQLRQGDMVETESGSAELVEVSREMYRGNVHNLKLDKGADPAAASHEGSTMYANGFLVGDLDMQRALEFNNGAEERNTLERLPAAWHADYRNHLAAQAAAEWTREP